MSRSILDRFGETERRELIDRLMKVQKGKSYISGKEIDLRIDQVEVDHIVALDRNGPDDESNWAVVIASENSSKGKKDLQLMKYIYDFRIHREKYLKLKRDFTFGDALNEYYPNRFDFIFDQNDKNVIIKYLNQNNEKNELSYPIIVDPLNKEITSFVGMVPLEIINHDATVNPRSIVDLELMIEEFYNENPQLFPSLAVMEKSNDKYKIMAFDGQHKAAAQLYLRSKYLFLRVFINVEKAKIKKTNLRAHTVVAQIHFPKLIEDKVGHDLFSIEFEPYIDSGSPTKLSEQSFIKQDEIKDEYRNYLNNYYKYNALFDENGERHNILNYVETITARSKTHPISYDTLTKTFLKLLYLRPAEEKLSKTSQYRKIENENMWHIMEIFVEKCLNKRFDLDAGIFKIEDKLITDPNSVTDEHLIAYRICRQAAMVNWVDEFKKALSILLKTKNKYDEALWSEERVLWANMDENDFDVVGKMFCVIRDQKLWREKTNGEVISALGSTKISDWKNLLLNGKLPGREEKLFDPLNDTVIFNKAIKL
ncbi:MAG: HNH endonuclease [Treponema sp.]|nr:HNH endonuclease [Treponema sp.]